VIKNKMLGFIYLSLLCSLATGSKYAIQNGRAVYDPLIVSDSFKDELIVVSTMEDFYELSELAKSSGMPEYEQAGKFYIQFTLLDSIKTAFNYMQRESIAKVINLSPDLAAFALMELLNDVFEPHRIPVCRNSLILSRLGSWAEF
jgi:hypothetical protein